MGQRVRDIRKKHGMTLAELGEHIGRSKQWLSELERGNIRLTYDMAVKIAQVFGKTPDIFCPFSPIILVSKYKRS